MRGSNRTTTAPIGAALGLMVAAFVATAQPHAAHAAPQPAATSCQLGTDNAAIQHVVFLQFDNVHFRRDNPNIPSDLEQMPNLLNFLQDNGTLLTNHFTPLISHTATDILTTLTGVYGSKMGIPVANSYGFFRPDGSVGFSSSFLYWTAKGGDGLPQMIDQRGKTHPAPWVAFTRSGCDVGAFSIANMEFESIPADVNTVFGATSPEGIEANTAATRVKAQADFLGIAVHCAQNSPLCATGRDDLLPDEPGGYTGFKALFGNKYVQPAISPSGNVTDLDGNVIQDAAGNPGFPNVFNPSASQSLGYLATMLEAGVPVVYGYVSDAHDNHIAGSGTFGPGEAGYVTQLQQYNDAFGKFFARLQADGIDKSNTLFVITADENDHFVGGAPSPANCDGITVPCTYAQKGEINGDLSRMLATERGNVTQFSVHSDDAPNFYIRNNPGQTDSVTRTLERDTGALRAVNPITGNTDVITQRMADILEMDILHMVTSTPTRTPNFTMFANADYFLSASTSKAPCGQPLCQDIFVEQAGFAWNHGDFQQDITKTWLGMVGPGVKHLGPTGFIFSDHTDVRPTMLTLAGLKDDYVHDGRTLVEILKGEATPKSLSQHQDVLTALAQAYKQINAPLGTFGVQTLALATQGVTGPDTLYTQTNNDLATLKAQRDALAGQMLAMLEDAEFNGTAINVAAANALINQANALLAMVQ
jgi:hypothetical protein